jgi:hypothetical protein
MDAKANEVYHKNEQLFPPKEGLPFVISSLGHVSEFGFDMFVRCYECMWVNYYVGDLLRFFSTLGFNFQI